jgi:hypothetical protein
MWIPEGERTASHPPLPASLATARSLFPRGCNAPDVGRVHFCARPASRTRNCQRSPCRPYPKLLPSAWLHRQVESLAFFFSGVPSCKKHTPHHRPIVHSFLHNMTHSRTALYCGAQMRPFVLFRPVALAPVEPVMAIGDRTLADTRPHAPRDGLQANAMGGHLSDRRRIQD